MTELETTSEDGEKKASHFPDVVIRELNLHGGPHPRAVEIEIDGKVLEKVTHMELVADVNDVLRLTTTQIVSVGSAMLRVGGWDQHYAADIRVFPFIPGEGSSEDPIKVEGKGANAIEALEDAVRQLKELEDGS